MPEIVKLSVGKLVSFACRSGDLHPSGPAGPTAQQGQAVHKALQAERSESTQAEVLVKNEIRVGTFTVKLQGRIDLVNHSDDAIRLGEIKSTYVPADNIPQSQKDLHAAQLKVYGYCYLLQQETTPEPDSTITLELIWFNIKSGKKHTEHSNFRYAELEQFTLSALDLYLQWYAQVNEIRKRTLTYAVQAQFPLGEFRKGQREMAAGIYCSARDAGSLLLEAPTGIGKTISAMFAASKALGEKHIDRFIYLTAKNSGRQAAARALHQLKDAGQTLTAITITAKKTTCHCSNGRCTLDDDGRCPLTIGFFDRLPAARESLIDRGVITPEHIDETAAQYQLCPFELIQQMLPWVDAIVCDYNYVFDPLVRFAFFEETAARSLLLVDEAHNLLDRARSMNSARLNRNDIRMAAADIKTGNPLLHNELLRLNRAISRWSNSCEGDESACNEPPKAIGKAISRCMETMADSQPGERASSESMADLAKEIFRYAVIEDLFAKHHRTITLKKSAKAKGGAAKWRTRGNILIQLRCLDASASLQKRLAGFRAAVVFSATLRPWQFYLQSLGMPPSTTTLALNSPFPSQQQLTSLCSYVDTRFHARENSLPQIVDIVHCAYQAQPGNYQIFFPSYAYMEQAHRLFAHTHPDIPLAIQQRDSSEAERESFLARFSNENRLLSFAIMGGIYGEGVDYLGDRLIGSIVVGTGLPAVTLEQKLIEQHYADQQLNGFDYAGRYPGLTRVLQTAGRVIRSERDRGVVILIDARFDQAFYRSLFPQHWQINNCTNLSEVKRQLGEFWQRANPPASLSTPV